MSGTEYDVTIVLPGDEEGLRPRLVSALERLGYRIYGEQPLLAKRRANGWEILTMSVLDYAIDLTIQLKTTSEGATLTTFDYLIHDPIVPPGWKQIIESEAHAIAAFASQSAWSTICPVCNADSGTESRFCRRCGAPLAPPEPAELEVLRYTAESRAAFNNLVISAFLIINTGLILFTLMLNGNTSMKLMLFLFFLNALGWLPLFRGLVRLRRALTPGTENYPRAQDKAPSRIPALPPKPLAISVTENTTELLDETGEPAPARLQQSSRDTA
ncbi:MAG TPA: hypothetical protein VKA70_10905 [Blastocatellia bacterium]|nr:hypothetical protein [Blastocatellia bacterium]